MQAYLQSLNITALGNALPGGLTLGLIWGIMALGLFLTYKVLGFSDLSVDGSLATGGAVSVMLIQNGWKPEITLLFAFIVGCLAGLITGLLNTKLGIPDILAGILTQISLYSINLNIMGKANQAINLRQVTLYISMNAQSINRTIIILIILSIIVICALYWYLGTEHGSALRATGNNRLMARAQGINTSRMTVITLMLSNGLVAFAGALLSQATGFADINMGRGAIVIGLAAIIIGQVLGEAILKHHLNFMGRLVFVVISAIIYYFVYDFVIWLKFPSDDMKLLTAVVVAVFLAVPYLRDKSKTSFAHLGRVNKKMGGNN